MEQPILEREIHLSDYLRVVQKRLWIILLIFVAAVTMTAANVSKLQPYYQAAARIQIERESPNIIGFQEVVPQGYNFWGEEYYETQVKLLKSRSLAQEVVRRLNLRARDMVTSGPAPPSPLRTTVVEPVKRLLGIAPPSPQAQSVAAEVAIESLEERRLVGMVQGMISISPVKGTQLVDLVGTSGNPRLAAAVVNALAEAFIERNLRLRINTTKDATKWLTTELEEARKKVETSENALQRYKEAKDILVSKDRQDLVAQKLDELNSALIKAKTERITLETRYQQMEKAGGDSKSQVTPDFLEDSMAQTLRKEYLELKNELETLSKTYTSKHPRIISLKERIKSQEEQIKAEINKVRKSIKNEYEVALAKERSFQEAVDQQKIMVQDLNQRYIQYDVLEREVQNNRRIYDVLLSRAKETGLVEGLQVGNIRIIDPAEVPGSPAGPNKNRSILLAVVLGLVGGLGFAFFLEYMDDSVKDPDDLEHYIQLPFLAPVPLIKPKGNHPKELVAHTESRSPAAEGYRSARTSIIYSSPDTHPAVLMVTSSGPEEGKTTTAINMAVTMAHDGKRTLLLDADLRKPRVHHVFHLGNEQGLTNLLTDASDVGKLARSTGVPNLWVVPSGPIPPNPSELLGSKRMKKLIASLRQNFDMVVFDSPPVISVTDASILASSVDGVLLVVKAGKTSRKIVLRAKKKLIEVRARIIGVILNAVNIRKSRYYYSPVYYYSYYGEEKKKRVRKKAQAST
jgi:capsular exopolysaccharide synthesis family protein